MPAASFQVKLGGEWKDYDKEEDTILKRAFLAGFPFARFSFRDQNYEYDFKKMEQKNLGTGKSREIRAPHKWKQPAKALVASGPTTTVKVPKGPGGRPPKSIRMPHPKRKGEFFMVNVPKGAKVGQVLLVPVPEHGEAKGSGKGKPSTGGAVESTPAEEYKKAEGGSGMSGKSAAAWTAGAAVAGAGLGVGGMVLGEHIAEEGWDATLDAAGDGLADAGDAAVDFGEDAGEWIVDAADDVGDFVMDLF